MYGYNATGIAAMEMALLAGKGDAPWIWREAGEFVEVWLSRFSIVR